MANQELVKKIRSAILSDETVSTVDARDGHARGYLYTFAKIPSNGFFTVLVSKRYGKDAEDEPIEFMKIFGYCVGDKLYEYTGAECILEVGCEVYDGHISKVIDEVLNGVGKAFDAIFSAMKPEELPVPSHDRKAIEENEWHGLDNAVIRQARPEIALDIDKSLWGISQEARRSPSLGLRALVDGFEETVQSVVEKLKANKDNYHDLAVSYYSQKKAQEQYDARMANLSDREKAAQVLRKVFDDAAEAGYATVRLFIRGRDADLHDDVKKNWPEFHIEGETVEGKYPISMAGFTLSNGLPTYYFSPTNKILKNTYSNRNVDYFAKLDVTNIERVAYGKKELYRATWVC